MNKIQFVFAIIKNINGALQIAESNSGDNLVSEPEEFIEDMLKLTENSLGTNKKHTTEEFKEAFKKVFWKWSIEFKKKTIYMK